MRRISIIALILSFMISAAAAAADLEYELRIGATRSDNVRRTALAEVDDTFTFAGFVLDLSHSSKAIELEISSDLEFQSYVDDTFDDDVVGAFYGELIAIIVPEVLTWNFRDNFGQIRTNPFGALTPDNRENVNTFSTGPDLQIRLGRVTAISVGAYYKKTTFEIRDIDNDVVGGQISLVRTLSSKRSLSLDFSSGQVEYENTDLNDNFDRQTASLGFSSEMSRGAVSINGGVNEIKVNGETADGFFGGFSITRQLSPRSSLNFSFDQRLSDAGDIFSRYQRGRNFGETQDISGTSDPFENKRLGLAYDMERELTSFFVSIDFNNDEYLNDNFLDQKRSGIQAGVSRKFGSGWSFSFDLYFSRSEFTQANREDDYSSARVGLAKKIARTVALDLAYERNERASNAAAAEYVENLVRLTISYGK